MDQPTPTPAQPPAELPPIQYPPDTRGEMSTRSLMALFSGGIGAAIGWLSGGAYATLKMLRFEKEYLEDARKDFLGKGGAGAGAAEGMGGGAIDHGMSNGFGGLGRGMASHEITEYHRLKLINSGKHEFPKLMEVMGGRGTFAMLTAAVGGLIGYVGFRALAPNDPSKVGNYSATQPPQSSQATGQPTSWSDKVGSATLVEATQNKSPSAPVL